MKLMIPEGLQASTFFFYSLLSQRRPIRPLKTFVHWWPFFADACMCISILLFSLLNSSRKQASRILLLHDYTSQC